MEETSQTHPNIAGPRYLNHKPKHKSFQSNLISTKPSTFITTSTRALEETKSQT